MKTYTFIRSNLLAAALLVGTAQANITESNLSFSPSVLRLNATGEPSVITTLTATSWDSQSTNCLSQNPATSGTVIAVHGLAHTASTWKQFATNILTLESLRGQKVCRFVAIDLPGRGQSTDPVGMPFGNLVLDDYVTALTQVIPQIGQSNLTLLGHSQGGLVIQMLQERLRANSASLSVYGVKRVVLLAPSLPSNVTWSYAANPPVDALNNFLMADAQRGYYLSLPDAAFPFFFYLNLQGNFNPALFPDAFMDVTTNHYNSAEPLAATLQLFRLPIPLPDGSSITLPTSVRTGLFAKDIEVILVAFSQDPFSTLDEANTLLRTIIEPVGMVISPSVAVVAGDFSMSIAYYNAKGSRPLTSGPKLGQLLTVAGTYAVHDTYLTQPAELAGLLR